MVISDNLSKKINPSSKEEEVTIDEYLQTTVKVNYDSEISNHEIYAFLKQTDEFSGVSEKELVILVNSCRFADINAGEYITHEGDEDTRHGFIVVSGCISMLKTSISGKELIVELLQKGDAFGLLLTLATIKLPSELAAQALQKSRILWVPIKNFDLILQTNPILFKDYVGQLLLSLQSSYRLARGLAHDRVEVRIATVLSSLVLKYRGLEASQKSFSIKLTRQQLADLTGTTTETSIRITRSMQREGLVDISRPGIICVTNLKGLQLLIDD